MTVHQIASPYLRNPLDRTEAQAADDQARNALRWAKRLRRVVCTDRQGQPAGIDRRALMLAEAEMRDMLLDHDLRPAEVIVTGRLTARQWCIALCIAEFCAADLVPTERRPEGLEPARTRSWFGVDWLRDPDLPGARTKRAVCELRAKAGGKEFLVEVIASDLVEPKL